MGIENMAIVMTIQSCIVKRVSMNQISKIDGICLYRMMAATSTEMQKNALIE